MVASETEDDVSKSQPQQTDNDENKVSKRFYRLEVWQAMRARFPQGAASSNYVTRKIPFFPEAEQTAERLAETPEFQAAANVKVNIDMAQESVKLQTLKANKTLFVAPSQKSDFLYAKILLPANVEEVPLAQQRRIVKMLAGEETYQELGIDNTEPLDMIVVGCVAVSKSGQRIGKGNGYVDLEIAILTELGVITPKTVIATTVADEQVYDELPGELFQSYDFTVDLIVTPTRIIRVEPRPAKRTGGVQWGLLSSRRLDVVRVLKKLKERLEAAGRQIELKDEDTDVESFRKRRSRGSGSGGGGGGEGGGHQDPERRRQQNRRRHQNRRRRSMRHGDDDHHDEDGGGHGNGIGERDGDESGGGGEGAGGSRLRRKRRFSRKPRRYSRRDSGDREGDQPQQQQQQRRQQEGGAAGGGNNGGRGGGGRVRNRNGGGTADQQQQQGQGQREGQGQQKQQRPARQARPVLPDGVRIRVSNMFSVRFKDFKDELRTRNCYPMKISKSRHGKCLLIFSKRDDADERTQTDELLEKLADMRISVQKGAGAEVKQIRLKCEVQHGGGGGGGAGKQRGVRTILQILTQYVQTVEQCANRAMDKLFPAPPAAPEANGEGEGGEPAAPPPAIPPVEVRITKARYAVQDTCKAATAAANVSEAYAKATQQPQPVKAVVEEDGAEAEGKQQEEEAVVKQDAEAPLVDPSPDVVKAAEKVLVAVEVVRAAVVKAEAAIAALQPADVPLAEAAAKVAHAVGATVLSLLSTVEPLFESCPDVVVPPPVKPAKVVEQQQQTQDDKAAEPTEGAAPPPPVAATEQAA